MQQGFFEAEKMIVLSDHSRKPEVLMPKFLILNFTVDPASTGWNCYCNTVN